MKNFKLYLLTIVIFSTLFIIISYANAGQPSKGGTTKLIQKHIEDFYYRFPVQIQVGLADNRIKSIIKAQNFGIIETVLKSGLSLGDANRNINGALIGDVFEIQISEKVKNSSHFTTPDNKIAIKVMHRKIDEIIQMEENDKYSFTIFFSYTGIPNEIGKFYFHKNEYKYKGKAILLYDVFTKQYVFDNLFWSPWDRLERSATTWVAEEDNKKIIKSTKR